jgi:hypothetical protein
MTPSLDKALAAVRDGTFEAALEYLVMDAWLAGFALGASGVCVSKYDSFANYWEAVRTDQEHMPVFAVGNMSEETKQLKD